MKADKIIKNARIYTSDKTDPEATALVVKDGKFIYVGDEAGLAAYEGEVTDFGGKFITPALIDSHVHVSTGTAFEYVDLGVLVLCPSKQESLDFMADYIQKNPGLNRYRFALEKSALNGEDLTTADLDAICPDHELIVLEIGCHSNWVNSKVLAAHGITDATPDPVPELAYFVRKDGHLTGESYETASWPFLFDGLRESLTDDQIRAALSRWIESSTAYGVSAVFDAGFPEHNDILERIYGQLRQLDIEGKLPIYVDGCYVLTQPAKLSEAMEGVKRFQQEFNTEHMKVHTLKIFMDGTMKIETAAMVTPYEDGVLGATAFNAEQMAQIVKELNEAGLDLHVHTVGEAASRVILDGVEMAKKELGEKYHVKVTCAHLWVQDDADMNRFTQLGVTANFTPWWHGGNIGGNPIDLYTALLGEKRAHSMYRCKTLWNSGALVTWSSDEVFFGDFKNWSPYLGMEIGMTRWINEKTRFDELARTIAPFPPENEKMGIEEMLQGYSINGAKQLGIEACKGSITVGKDADFLVFDQDLLSAEPAGISFTLPSEVYFAGKKMK
ncbi:MAG: amidohydrolase family protein [Paludibacteraceae bacterium]|nr:amidohydrolase family protein [Paludibacteraceae bacterium]